VYGIESPSALDVIANRTESETLSAVCKMLGHGFGSAVVRSTKDFEAALKHITSINEQNLRESQRGRPLCIHIAAHGNDTGLAFGADSESWKSVATNLWAFLTKMDDYTGKIIMVISACGAEKQKVTKYFAEFAKKESGVQPPHYVITTLSDDEGEVYWRDSVVAWSLFYHQIGNAAIDNSADFRDILDKIQYVGCGALRYFRWDKFKKRYVSYKSSIKEHRGKSKKEKHKRK
jgi:hypothetical protein